MSSSKRGKENPNVASGATLYSKNRKKRDKDSKREASKRLESKLDENSLNRRFQDVEYEAQLIRYLGNHGIEVGSYKERYILRRLRVRMGRLKVTSYKEYLEYVKSHQKELAEIQESLSINVTRFFRNRDTFDKVQKDILPVLLSEKKSIKIWSAGCAVGAEPYTIAMIASNVASKTSNVSILATDVKEDLLRTARFGSYTGPYLDEMHDHEIRKYFLEMGDGVYKVKPHIKSLVSFQQQDLMKDDYPRNVDMVFCRNVLIYVDRQAQNQILNKFFKALNPGGILVLGRTETLFGDWRKSVDIISTKHRIYQKKNSSEFQPISLGPTALQNVLGERFDKKQKTDLLKKKRTTSKSGDLGKKNKRISKINSPSTSDRLNELRNFRQTFEERKKIWEERLERSKRERQARRDSISSTSVSKSRGKQIEVESNQTLSNRLNHTTEMLRESRAKLSNMRGTFQNDEDPNRLANYRKLLRKSDKPTRIAKVRKDMKESDKD